jgi:hypothetical protein
VDDIEVRTNGPHRLNVQVKTGLTLSRATAARKPAAGQAPLPPLASAIDQAVRASTHELENGTGAELRDIVPYVIVAGPGSSAPVAEHLPKVLDRLRTLRAGEPLARAAKNAEETTALTTVVDIVRSSLRRTGRRVPKSQDIRAVLARIQIDARAARDPGTFEREAKLLLRNAILRDTTQSSVAWDALVALGRHLATTRQRADRRTIRAALTARGIRLRAPESYRSDIERLATHSRKARERLEDYTFIKLGSKAIRVSREAEQAAEAAVRVGSVLIVGAPGAGKSGVLVSVADELHRQGNDVLMLDASTLASHSAGALKGELGLQHDLGEVLANWIPESAGFLILDALDVARGETAARTLRELIADVRRHASHWQIVASVREYELRHNPDLGSLFPLITGSTSLAGVAVLPGLERIRHIAVTDFDDVEMRAISAQSQIIKDLFDSAPPRLAALLRNPFNLRLAAELLDSGVSATSLRGIKLRVELLDRYWQARVIAKPDPRDSDARESVLRAACQRMVQLRRLSVDRADLTENPAAGRPLSEVLEANVLKTFAASAGALPDRSILTFPHHVLFDYAVARLLLRGSSHAHAERLADDPDLVLMVRPSLVLHFQWLWSRDSTDVTRTEFWTGVFAMFAKSAIRTTAQIVGPGVAVELTESTSDLAPLTASLRSADPATRTVAERVLQYIVGAITAAPLPSPTASLTAKR